MAAILMSGMNELHKNEDLQSAALQRNVTEYYLSNNKNRENNTACPEWKNSPSYQSIATSSDK
jgi:hypothetical protein